MGDVTFDRIRWGVCGYNQEGPAACICDDLPLPDTEEWNEPEYRQALERKGHVEIFAFLCEWDMTVVHFRQYHFTKPSQLKERIQPVHAVLPQLRGASLATYSDASYGSQVAEAFDVLRRPESKRKGIGLTSPAKVLHVLMPELFVPWDQKIRNSYGIEDEDEGEGYRAFMQMCATELKTVLGQMDAGELAGKFYAGGWKPDTKILDEYHFAMLKRSPPHFSR